MAEMCGMQLYKNPENPTLLLLHGFPSSSHMFRELIPELEDKFYLIAPVFPGFGQTESPSRSEFDYTFDHLAKIVDKFTEAMPWRAITARLRGIFESFSSKFVFFQPSWQT